MWERRKDRWSISLLILLFEFFSIIHRAQQWYTRGVIREVYEEYNKKLISEEGIEGEKESQ